MRVITKDLVAHEFNQAPFDIDCFKGIEVSIPLSSKEWDLYINFKLDEDANTCDDQMLEYIRISKVLGRTKESVQSSLPIFIDIQDAFYNIINKESNHTLDLLEYLNLPVYANLHTFEDDAFSRFLASHAHFLNTRPDRASFCSLFSNVHRLTIEDRDSARVMIQIPTVTEVALDTCDLCLLENKKGLTLIEVFGDLKTVDPKLISSIKKNNPDVEIIIV